MQRFLAGLSSLVLLAACAGDGLPSSSGATLVDDAALPAARGGSAGAVYILSNDATANAVLVFARNADGSLGPSTTVPTGGTGTGAGLGNQGALALSADGRFLYAVNAGSNEISAFRVTGRGLELLGKVGSGGDQPISLALNGNLLYALNDGGVANVSGFWVGRDGTLSPIAGSSRALSTGAPDAAQVGISPDGRHLLVTEKATNLLVGWEINADGTLGNRTLTPSASPTPFGFAFDKRGTAIVSEAVGGMVGLSVASSYRVGSGGLFAVSPSVATTETAACWIAVTPNGRFAYAANTGSGSVSGFAVDHDGSLRLLDADGVTGTTGGAPADADISRNGQFLYTRNGAGRSISMFRIQADGSLRHLGDVTGLPAGTTGLVSD